jgi:hypothetical protein
MGLINWIFDFYQHSRLERAHQDAAELRAEMATLRTAGGHADPERLLRAIGELALAVKTMQRVAIEKGVATEADFRRVAQAIDREDGAVDGRTPV